MNSFNYFVVTAADDEFPAMDEWIWIPEEEKREEKFQEAKDTAISHLLSGRGPQEIFSVKCERVAHATVTVNESSDPIV